MSSLRGHLTRDGAQSRPGLQPACSCPARWRFCLGNALFLFPVPCSGLGRHATHGLGLACMSPPGSPHGHPEGPFSAPSSQRQAALPLSFCPHPSDPLGQTLIIHAILFQPQAPGHRVYEAPQQSSEHCSCHRQGRHADPGGEGLLQTAGRAPHLRPGCQIQHARSSSGGRESPEGVVPTEGTGGASSFPAAIHAGGRPPGCGFLTRQSRLGDQNNEAPGPHRASTPVGESQEALRSNPEAAHAPVGPRPWARVRGVFPAG